MATTIQFDDQRARTYRKRVDVLAFQSADPIHFTKSWGDQHIRSGAWVIVPLSDCGEATSDVYGCDVDVFFDTYEPSPSFRPNRYRKKETVQAYQPGQAFTTDTVLSDGHVEVTKSRSDTYDGWVVRAKGGEIYPIEDEEFRRTYVEVLVRREGETYRIKSRNEHWASDGTPKRILTLDGGGVRGILTLGYLERIEKILRARHGGSKDFRLSHYFDLIAGTSTGAVIAAFLAKGRSVAEVRTLYGELASSIFRRSFFRQGWVRAKYSAKQLKKHLESEFKNNTMGSLSIETGLLVVAKRLDTGSTWPMNNNPNNPFFTARPNDRFFSNEDYPLRQVLRASTAAPSFFAPVSIEISKDGENPHGEFIDGGVTPHNNPALLALQLVSVSGFGATWPIDPDKLLLVSVGTGTAKPGTSKSWLAGKHAIKSIRSLMDDCAESVEMMLQWISSSVTARHIDAAVKDLGPDLLAERPLLHYLRYNIKLDHQWLASELDQTMTPKQVKKLQSMDRVENMPTLSALGVKAAQLQIDESHFPKSFDLG